MARWEFIQLYYYHYENPENSFGFFSIRGSGDQYERQEVRDLAQILTQLEWEGWKIEKVAQAPWLIRLSQPEAVKWQEVFQLSRYIE